MVYFVYLANFCMMRHFCENKRKRKQDRQCTHNVTMRRFRIMLLPYKSNKRC